VSTTESSRPWWARMPRAALSIRVATSDEWSLASALELVLEPSAGGGDTDVPPSEELIP
jgi:hypothetical protein